MAGRPASRGGGLTGLHYGLIAFVIVSVAALAGFIMQLTQNKKLQDEADQKTKLINEDYGRPPQFYLGEARNRRSTAFAVMENYLKDYGTLVTGNTDAVYPAVAVQAERVLANAAREHEGLINTGDTLIGALGRLSSLLADERRRTTDLSDQLNAALEEKANLTEQNQELSEGFQEEVESLKQDYEQSTGRHAAALDEKEGQRAALQENFERTAQALQQIRVEIERGGQVKDKEITRLLTLVGDLQRKISEIQPSSFDPAAILTKADGKILRAIPGSDLVYINLGSNDGVKVGMGFEVFSTIDIPEGLRGKASLEVATVMSDTAECRVTRSTPAQPIIEDDLVVNIAFERNRLPKFVVRGDFDLDYDGQPDGVNGREKVEGLIRQWGGQVAADLDETTDFVVIGTAPFVPTIPVGKTATAVVMAQADAAQLSRVDFQDLIERANATYIPVITQSQFLFLTGYAEGLFGQQ